ncbi:MAG: Ig-like domain-containing protein [Saprospiraceae bacterium]
MKNSFPLNLAFASRTIGALLMLLVFLGQANAQCDQTIVQDTMTADYMGSPIGFCVKLEFMVAIRADRYIDGVLQTDFPEGCDFDSLVYYPYGTFPDAGAVGPYELVDWSVDGSPLNTMFTDVDGLVTEMNNFNPVGAWINEQFTQNIVGGEDGRTYSPMIVRQIGSGIERTVNPNISRTANGTIVIVDGAGIHEYVIDDPTTGCRDTIALFLRPVLDDIELEIFTDFETESAVFCLDNSGLVGIPQAATICDAPEDGVLNDQGGYCYTYTPNTGHSGSDEICIEVCDNTTSSSGPLCQRTIVTMITRSPVILNTDTVRFQMTNVDTTVCVNAVIDLSGPADFTEVCGPVPAGLTIVPSTNGCIDIFPDPTFFGDATICISHCLGTVCDTTILDFTVISSCDLGLFPAATDAVSSQGNPTLYCIPEAQATMSAYTFMVDGQIYTGPFSDCDVEPQFFYNYAPLFGNGTMGPYTLTRWTVNGQTFSTSFQDPTELEAFMRASDPSGDWSLDATVFDIIGGNPTSSYGSMVIVHNATGTQSELLANPINIARGTTIDLPGDGVYEIVVVDPNTGCSDEVTVTVGAPPPTITQTINVTVFVDSFSQTTCLFTSPRDTFSICGNVSNGTTTFDASNCVVYQPNPGFLGTDTLCVVSCDLPGGTVCDTTYAVFTVVPRVPTPTTTQTINVTVFVDSVSQTTCLFTLPRDTFSICGNVSNGTTTFDASNCVVYQPNPGFLGTDTLCVVSCDLPGGTVCDTTYAVFTVVPRVAPPTTTQTIDVTVFVDSFSLTTCLFTLPRDTFSICGAVSNGTTTFDVNNCVIYQPNPGFLGTDTLCVVSCDLPGGTVCDTTYAVFTVVPRVPVPTITQTIDVTVFVNSVSQTTCLFTSPRDTFSICGNVSNGTTTFDASNCVVYQPNPGFLGTDTLCVVSCDLPGGTVCDTTYAVFTVVPRTVNTTTQTIDVTVFVDSVSQTTCLFTSPRDTFSICGAVSNGTTTFDVNNCVIYRPNLGFLGTDTLCVVSCDLPGGTVCDTTYAVFTVVPRTINTTTQTIDVTVFLDSFSLTTCLFTSPRDTFSICSDVSNGTTTFDLNDCVVYNPDRGFLGTDTLCVVSCDLPGGTVCDTTYVIFTVVQRPPPVQTIFLTNFGDAPFNLCDGLPITGPFSSVTICGVTGPFTAEISPDGECVVADPTDGVSGTGEICVIFCSTTAPVVCQEVHFIITQTPSCAPPLFAQDTVTLGPSLGDVEYCLSNGGDLSDYEVYVNGALTTPTTDPTCGGGGGGGGQTVQFYPLLFINDGPLRIDGWDINGNLILNIVTTGFSELADTMTALDPGNDWTYDAVEQGLVATSNTGGPYSSLILFDLAFGSTFNIAIETIQQGGGGGGATGSVITLPTAGLYNVEVIALDGNCGDRLVIYREGASVPGIDTARFAAIADQSNGPFCLDVTELGAAPTSIQSCGDPVNGTIVFTSFECLTYEPNPGFVGMDTACVVICTNGGLLCDTTVVVFTVTDNSNCPEIWTETNVSVTTDDCTALVSVCLPAFPDEFFNYTVSVDGVVQTGALACGADTVTTYSYADVAGQGQAGPYRIEGYALTSGTYTDNLGDINTLVDSLNQWDPNGNWMLNPSNFTIFGGVSGFAYDTIRLRQIATDTLNRLVPVTTLIENQLGFDLPVGSYAIGVTDIRTSCTDTIRYDVVCTTGNDCPDLTAANGTDLTLVDCDGTTGFEVFSPTTDPSELDVFVDGSLVSSTANAGSIIVFLSEGTYEVTVVDPIRSCASTFTVTVVCGPCPGPLASNMIGVGADCSSNELEICLPAAPDVLQAYAITVDGQPYTGALGDCDEVQTFVLDIFELPDGGAVGPYTIDSFFINGQRFSTDVTTMQSLADTLNTWDATGTWRYDAIEMLILGGNPLSVYSELFVTQVSTSAQAQVALTSQSIAQGTVITIPVGTANRVLTFDNGVDCIQEVTLTIACTSNSTATDTIPVTGSTFFCVDASELSGPIVSLTNVCPDLSGAAIFDFDGILGCVTATGVTPGSVTACLVACDAAGVCDTTFYTVVVTPDGSGGLDAVDDILRLRLDQMGLLSITANDTFNGALSSIDIIEQPSRGIATLNSDGTLSYTPPAGECGFTDSLTYQICQGAICDRALVLIDVRCAPVEAYTGFSPNGDGVNDQLRFIGIEDFPENTLTVYNRWGNEVYLAQNYQNDWDGTWNGKLLIDGTYFWQLEIVGEDEPLTGYVQIQR